MINNHTLSRSESGAGLVNTDVSGYRNAIANKKRDKYIKGLEQRILKLESAQAILEKTIKEISK